MSLLSKEFLSQLPFMALGVRAGVFKSHPCLGAQMEELDPENRP